MFDPLKAKANVLAYTTAAFLFGLGMASGLGWTASSFAMPLLDQDPEIPEEVVQPALDVSSAFVAIAEAVTPAVVRIEVERTRTTAQRGSGPIPEEFRRFFQFPDEGDQEGRGGPPSTAGGSGFVVSPNGYIMTNDHVVSGAERIRVFFPDGRELEAELVGSDRTTDIAVLRVAANDLPRLALGSNRDLRVGEWVLAVGNPGFGGPNTLDYTVTSGIVSATGRSLDVIRRELGISEGQDIAPFAIEDFIQTDAVINPGNSGGPMVNLRGQVVGINTAIASRTGFYQGYGFAVPIDLAKRVMEDLVEYGHVRRAYLGVSMKSVDATDAEYYDLPRVAGALVQAVPEDGPARTAGFRPGDVIVAIDGDPVERSNQLQMLIAQKRPGDEIEVEFYRDGSRASVDLQLGEAPFTREAEAPRAAAPVRAEEKIGIEVTDLDSDLRQQLGYEEASGAVIRRVAPGGPAARRGVPEGLLIDEINGEQVETAEDVETVLQEASSDDIVNMRLVAPDGTNLIFNIRVP